MFKLMQLCSYDVYNQFNITIVLNMTFIYVIMYISALNNAKSQEYVLLYIKRKLENGSFKMEGLSILIIFRMFKNNSVQD